MKIKGKRYLLLKDLPFCDAGEIVAEWVDDGKISICKVKDGRGLINNLRYKQMKTEGIFNDWFKEIPVVEHWTPSPDHDYWCIDDDGAIKEISRVSNAASYTEERIEMGNCFMTEKDARYALKKLETLRKLREQGLKFENYCFDTSKSDSDYRILIRARINKLKPYSGAAFEYAIEDLDLLFREKD